MIRLSANDLLPDPVSAVVRINVTKPTETAMRECYGVFMNDEVDRLPDPPKPRRFQVMTVVSFM